MESFRTIFFPRYTEKKDDRTKRCDSARNVESNCDRYKQSFVGRDADKPQIVRIYGRSL